PFAILVSAAIIVSLLIWATRPPPPLPYVRPVLANLPPDAIPCDETRIMATYPSIIIAKPELSIIDQNTVDAQIELGTPESSIIEVQKPVPGQAFQAAQFLELPFPYDGGNVKFGGNIEQFRRANRSAVYGGRITGFFDHYYPLYPAPTAGNVTQGREPAQEPIGRNMLIFDGSLVSTGYSGHPAYDYSPFERNQSTTPLFAAADGIVDDVAIHQASGAYYVRIKHIIPNIGNYQTTYWHLEPDTFFDQMLPRIGNPISAGERIGTIGNTGWSTGHHLHFEVRFDSNRDGIFGIFEKVDPFGFVPSAEFPNDPWAEPFQITDAKGQLYTHAPIPSRYLWKHSMGFSAEVPRNGGGILPSGGASGAQATGGAGEEPTGCAPPSTFPPGGTVNWLWAPDPAPTIERAGMGQGCALSVFEADGTPVTQFNKPLRIELPYNDPEITHLDPESLKIWWKSGGTTNYVPIPTTLTLDEATGQKYAVAYTDIPGHCALMGRPTQDFLPPKTHILLEGAAYDQYSFAGDVRVTLTSGDPDLDRIEYSVDGGTTWEVYSDPFEILANGSPPTLRDEVTEGLPQNVPGLNLILAMAYDKSGNYEEPANSALIIIDPDKGSGNPTRRVVPHPCCDD
ncbi:MAG: M23 family metallopeptidase, partial [Candidatus Promineifilaceae bacterium]